MMNEIVSDAFRIAEDMLDDMDGQPTASLLVGIGFILAELEMQAPNPNRQHIFELINGAIDLRLTMEKYETGEKPICN